eukprot:CAMPEP_0172678082 /NCGR_PEP_ID=MMETSP1074-20121228/15130_1 /TAXON_ID=2916 /ORGANISM="Ceratium fusus, Strain PA161109" /LENGTH=36 /DNA_ID= /DNA_START= /DNA_END= /DNA_ORIENTATION=
MGHADVLVHLMCCWCPEADDCCPIWVNSDIATIKVR